MMLYILRHATAEEAASSGDDGARKLSGTFEGKNARQPPRVCARWV